MVDKMNVMSSTNQVPLGAGPRSLAITLPMGQDIGSMSFTKEQQLAAAAKRRLQSRDARPQCGRKLTVGPFALKTVSSMSALPQQRDIPHPKAPNARPRSKPGSRRSSSDIIREAHWQDMEIPPELEEIHADTPEEIRSIIQESMDEHRAMRASRMSQPQAIVVRTTITQSRTSDDSGPRSPLTESSASTSNRRAESSLSGDMSSTPSIGYESTTSLGSEGDNDCLKPLVVHDNVLSKASREKLTADTKGRPFLRRRHEKPLQERGIFENFKGSKGPGADYGTEQGDDRVASRRDVALRDVKNLEDRVILGHRYYCASLGCATWVDAHSALAYDGALRCPHCWSFICNIRQDAAKSYEKHYPNGSQPLASMRQADDRDFSGFSGEYHAGGSADEEARSAIVAIAAAERLALQRHEDEERRLAEEARQTTAREYDRLGRITDFFEYLRETVEKIRLQQKQAIDQRHSTALQGVEEREAALVCGERILDWDQKAAMERAELVKKNEDILKDLRRSHALQLMDTVRRHRKEQDAYIAKSTRQSETNGNVDQATVLEMLLQAQEVERTMLRSQQTREIEKRGKRASRLLEAFNAKTQAGREEIVKAQTKEAEELTQMATAVKKQISADWKWFNAIFLGRAMMLGEDERRLILSGSDAPKPPYDTLFS